MNSSLFRRWKPTCSVFGEQKVVDVYSVNVNARFHFVSGGVRAGGGGGIPKQELGLSHTTSVRRVEVGERRGRQLVFIAQSIPEFSVQLLEWQVTLHLCMRVCTDVGKRLHTLLSHPAVAEPQDFAEERLQTSPGHISGKLNKEHRHQCTLWCNVFKWT